MLLHLIQKLSKGNFQIIYIHFIDQNGKKYYFDDDDFIVYLDLIKE